MATNRRAWLFALAAVVVGSEASAQSTVSGAVRWGDGVGGGSVVWLVPAGRPAGTPPAAGVAEIDQSHLRFEPALLVVRRGTSVRFLNSDDTMHNVFSPRRRGAGFNLGTYPRGESRTFLFRETGQYVVLCHVHPEMVAWVVVVPVELHAMASEEGRFRIDDVPRGSYRLVAWHHRKGTVEVDLRVAAGDVTGIELRPDGSGPGRPGGR